MGAVDVWAQVITERMAKQPWLAPLLRWSGRTNDDLLPSVERTLQAMDEAGFDIALLSAWRGPEGELISNDEVSRQIAAAPKRFRGLATVNLHNPTVAVRDIRRWVDGKTFVGVRIVPWLWDLPPNDRRYYPIYAACVDAGVPFCTQIGHTGRSGARRPGGSFLISKMCCSIFPSSWLSAATSAFLGSTSSRR